jgi:hypothetical protein
MTPAEEEKPCDGDRSRQSAVTVVGSRDPSTALRMTMLASPRAALAKALAGQVFVEALNRLKRQIRHSRHFIRSNVF